MSDTPSDPDARLTLAEAATYIRWRPVDLRYAVKTGLCSVIYAPDGRLLFKRAFLDELEARRTVQACTTNRYA